MFLKSLYSEPEGLFPRVDFRDGINIIFGKKDVAEDTKKSLNGIGKSMVLDLLDFCLMSSAQKNHNPRLYQARHLLVGHDIVLELEIQGQPYVIKRSIEKTKVAQFGKPDSLAEVSVNDLKEVLSEMVFRDTNYKGVYSPKWWRKLLPFFLKVQKHKKDRFLDPIKYISEVSIAEINQYQLFLLGMNNRLAVENYRVLTNLKRKKPAIREIKRLLEETYEIKSIKSAQNSINTLKRDIEQLEIATDNFVLADQYQDAEVRANILTSEIKQLWFENHEDRRLIESYNDSFAIEDELSKPEIAKISRLYEELRNGLGEKISKTLDQAREFRIRLRESRREFLSDEINRLNADIKKRDERIASTETDRKKLFEFLDAKEAIKDLTGAFAILSEKRKLLSDLEGKLKTYDTLEYERLDLEKVSKELEIEIKKFINEARDTHIPALSSIFAEVYNAIYPKANDSLFAITDQFSTEAKMQIDIEFPAMMSKGKNQGRTLVYDLAVLFHAIQQNIASPRFVVHDGIFDGMDKAHLAHLYSFLESQKHTHRFQYILTLNEEGTLSENFGPADDINPDRIAEEAILVLTPTKKLLGTDF